MYGIVWPSVYADLFKDYVGHLTVSACARKPAVLMEKATDRPSGLPRPSRLPVPRGGLRTSQSRESLQRTAVSVDEQPPLRHSTSRNRLSTVIPAKPNLSAASSRVNHRASYAASSATQQRAGKPIEGSFGRKTSQQFLLEQSNKIFGSNKDEQQQQYSSDKELLQDNPVGNGYSRKPRPSLSERTMETLQQIPSSPAVQRRTSNFFNPESPMRPPSRSSVSSRPGSRDQFDISTRSPSRSSGSRPGSAVDKRTMPDFRASTNTFHPPSSSLAARTPVKRQSLGNLLKTPVKTTGNVATKPPALAKRQSLGSIGSIARASSSSYTPVKTGVDLPTIKSGSKTVGAKTLRPRASVNSLFRKPSMPSLDSSNEIDRIDLTVKKKSTTLSSTSSEGTSMTSKSSKGTAVSSPTSDDQNTTPRKSSLALRDQIAKAKAAKRAALRKASESTSNDPEDRPIIPADNSFDFGLSDDPFNQNRDPTGNKGLLRKRVDAGRTTGRLNIAAMGFKEIPEEVLNMYNLDSILGEGSAWAESVDLTRFVAADNEIQAIGDDVFPDIDSQRALDDDDEAKGNQFGGLETLDLHGNLLKSVPLGFRRLELLTSLNLVSVFPHHVSKLKIFSALTYFYIVQQQS